MYRRSIVLIASLALSVAITTAANAQHRQRHHKPVRGQHAAIDANGNPVVILGGRTRQHVRSINRHIIVDPRSSRSARH